MKLMLSLIGAAALTAAGTPALTAGASQCFKPQDVGAHAIADNHTLYLNVAGHSVWRVKMRNVCLNGLQSSDPIDLKARAGSETICEAGDLDIHVTLAGGGGLPARCVVDELVKMTPAQVAALPSGMKP
jgi:hypothetical protein